MNKPIILIGNGGHAKVLSEILLNQNREIKGFTAPSIEKNPFGFSYLGTDDEIFIYSPDEIELVLCLGSVTVPQIRKKIFNLYKQKGYTFASVHHPNAIISAYAKIGEGVQIMAGTIIQPFVEIADNTIVNTGTTIDHECVIGRHCHISPGVTLSGNVHIDELSHIGTGTTIIQNVNIGESVLIGAGSLVLKNIESYSKAFGMPAKEVK